MTLSVEVQNLTMTYKDTVALNDLSFRLIGGRIYGLLGRNGAGKSSLLSILAAFRKQSVGVALIDGQPIFENARITPHIALIREAGTVAEQDESVATALAFGAYMRPNWDAAYAADLVERFEIPLKKKVSQLSLGKKSALGVTIGLATRAPVTMYDESYLGMDAPSRYAFYDELLADFMRHPRTVIVSTHLIEEISPLFEEVVIIDNGKLVAQEETDILRAHGARITGPASEVERLTEGLKMLDVKELGRTRSVAVYGQLMPEQRRAIESAGLDLVPLPLQDLFVHLTDPTSRTERADRAGGDV